ncbi:MAG: DUF4396 domain-containing protein [Nitrospiraceae bacterium]
MGLEAEPKPAMHQTTSLNRLSLTATLHCFIGCSIGEALGLVIATALGWGDVAAIVLAVLLAFVFGYAIMLWPLLHSGMSFATAARVAFAADTASITAMEIVNNAVMLLIPGAMDAGLLDPLLWGSLALALGAAFVAAWPVNRWLIARGRGTRGGARTVKAGAALLQGGAPSCCPEYGGRRGSRIGNHLDTSPRTT